MSFNKNLFPIDALTDIGERLLTLGETISVAESVTSGLLQAAFSTVENASKFYQGGITAYNLGQKSRHLNVEPIHAENCNCVSEETTREMAENVCNLFHSQWGIAVSGYAVPVPESGQQLYAYYSICHSKNVVLSTKVVPDEQDPQKVQLFYVNSILTDFRDFLKNTF